MGQSIPMRLDGPGEVGEREVIDMLSPFIGQEDSILDAIRPKS